LAIRRPSNVTSSRPRTLILIVALISPRLSRYMFRIRVRVPCPFGLRDLLRRLRELAQQLGIRVRERGARDHERKD
ncbi:hypothetical protein, partial [Citreimonas salinaria]|uniref:hypothetical protein n=1 Tax=Citreimonas salinaria TaxID=321339 RepID=UPI001C435E19